MATPEKDLIALENKFWKSLVDQDAEAAIGLLNDTALMVSPHGSMQFDHAAYRKMATQGTMTVTAYELSDMKVTFPNPSTAILTYGVKQTMKPRAKGESYVEEMNDSSTWVKVGNDWKCVMHTESPKAKEMAHA